MTPNAEYLAVLYDDEARDKLQAKWDAGDKETKAYMIDRKWGGLSRNCLGCKKPVSQADAVVYGSYWGGYKNICHRDCIAEVSRLESFECQLIDSNCNDCKHFNRVAGNVGTCADGKRDGEFRVYPANWQGMDCFIHRRGIK